MAWQRLLIHTSRDSAEAVSGMLATLGASAVTLEDSGDEPLFDQLDDRRPLWEHTTVAGLFPEDADCAQIGNTIIETLGLDPPPAFRFEALADQPWERVWLEHFRPVHIHGSLWICPTSMNAPDPAAVTVHVDPGLAFGTGTHPTTRLCLEWLARHAVTGKTIIDYGCGSGILAIAALKLGARHALGTDIDPQALDVARDNAVRNGVGEDLQLLLPAALPVELVADIVVANILAQPLIELAPQLKKRVRPGGWLVLSGLLAAQAVEVQRQYDEDFDLECRQRDGWALLAGPPRRQR